MGTINQNADWSHEILSASRSQMKVQFTDETTDTTPAPTRWLWDFGDGQYSLLQNPIHTFRGKWQYDNEEFSSATHNVEYTVKLTVWQGGTQKNHLTWLPNNHKGYGQEVYTAIDSFAAAQAAQKAALPYYLWRDRVPNNIRYEIIRPTTFRWGCRYGERQFTLENEEETSTVGYLTYKINAFWTSSGDYSGAPFALRCGEWDEVKNMWKWDAEEGRGDFRVWEIKWQPIGALHEYVCLQLDKYCGIAGTRTWRLSDGYDYEKSLVSGNAEGYWLHSNKPDFILFVNITPANKGVKSKTITPNEILISRPAILYSGIREAYFRGCWEDRKNFFIEVSKANPCTIQFFDLYVNTTNE